jgi:hypothetical protein
MTDPTASGTTANAAPGWYPDGSGGQRWWDGTAWTDHVAPSPAAAQPFVRPALPEGARIDTVWVWLVALCYLVSCVSLVFFDMGGYMRAVLDVETSADPSALMGALTGYVVWFLITWLLGLAVWGFTIFAAYRDYKHLESIGVVRPFHWAFTFIAQLVYLIGRHVVLRKVSRTTGWPLWIHIASYVALTIVSIVWSLLLVQSILSDFSSYVRYSSSFS